MIIKSYIAERNQEIFNHNLVLFYGVNIGLKADFKKKILENFKDFNVLRYLQGDILDRQNEFYNDLFNMSLFEKKKVFIVEQCNDKLLDIINEIKDKLETQNIYFFADTLEKKSKLRNFFEKSKKEISIACYEDTEISLRKIIQEKLNGFLGLNVEIMNILIDNCNQERSKLNNELEKITCYFIDKKIKTGELLEILNLKSNDDFSLIKDSALNGDKKKTNNLLSSFLIEGEKNIHYLYTINRRLRELNEAKTLSENKNVENIIDKLRPPIFWKDRPNFINQFKKWNKNKINLALEKTYKNEILIKSSSMINKNVLIKKLIIDLCTLANA